MKRISYFANTDEIHFDSVLRFTLYEMHFTRNMSMRFLDNVCDA
ncbi:MAG: hypothetical protein OJF50_001865 [Nitrospira sp.]|nr:hypothetical protein [Nitrospira sp.]